MILTWVMYADENDGRLVGSTVGCWMGGRPGPQWVQPPQDNDGVWPTNIVLMGSERVIYGNTMKVWKCCTGFRRRPCRNAWLGG